MANFDLSFCESLHEGRPMTKEVAIKFSAKTETTMDFLNSKYIREVIDDEASLEQLGNDMTFLKNSAVLGFSNIDWDSFKAKYKTSNFETCKRAIAQARAEMGVFFRRDGVDLENIVAKWVEWAKIKQGKIKDSKEIGNN